MLISFVSNLLKKCKTNPCIVFIIFSFDNHLILVFSASFTDFFSLLFYNLFHIHCAHTLHMCSRNLLECFFSHEQHIDFLVKSVKHCSFIGLRFLEHLAKEC